MALVQWKRVWWMLLGLLSNVRFYTDAEETDTIPGNESELEGWYMDNMGNSSILEIPMPDSLMLDSGSGDVMGALSRMKRGVLFPSGVKLCSQETVKQAVQNHLDYFHLRVCQEAVWEAFKIFWDRLPKRDEYQLWINRCQNGSISVFDIGRTFSQSPEHLAIITSRVQMASAEGQQATADPTKLDIISTLDGAANVTSLNPTAITAETPLTPTEARATSEEPGLTQTDVIVTTEQSTDASEKATVTTTTANTQQSMVMPNVSMVPKGESSFTPTEGIVSTEHSMDVATKAMATAGQSTRDLKITTEPLFMDTPSEEMLTTVQSTDTEAVKPFTVTPNPATVAISTNTPSKMLVTTEQSMDTSKEAIATIYPPTVTPGITYIAVGETTSTSRQTLATKEQLITVTTIESTHTDTAKTLVTIQPSMVTPNKAYMAIDETTNTSAKAILTTEESVYTAKESIVTVQPSKVITEQSLDTQAEAIEHSTVTATTQQFMVTQNVATETREESTITQTEVLVEPDQSTYIATSKQFTVTPNKVSKAQTTAYLSLRVSSMAKELEANIEVSDELPFSLTSGVMQRVNTDSLMEITSQTTEQMSPGTEPEVNHNSPELPLSTTPVSFEKSVNDITVEPSVYTDLGKKTLPEEPVHLGDDDDGGGGSGTALQSSPSPILGTALQPNEDEQPETRTLESTAPVDSLDMSLEHPPLSGNEDQQDGDEATSESGIVEEVAEDPSERTINSDPSVRVENDTHIITSWVGNYVEVTKYSISVEKKTLTGAKAILETPTTLTEVSLEENIPVTEYIHASAGADVSFDYMPLAFTPDPSVIILDVEDFRPITEVTPSNEEYTDRTNYMEIDKENHPEDTLLKFTVEPKTPEVLDISTSNLPEMTVLEGVDTGMSNDTEAPEGMTTSELLKTIGRVVTGIIEEDAPTVEVLQKSHMQQSTISSKVQASTQISNTTLNDGNMIVNEIADILPRSVRPIMDQVVEMSIKLRGETYDVALRDPSSFYYQHLSEQFIDKIEDAYKTLPGFQRAFIRRFRPQKDIQGGLAVVVHYTIILTGDAAGINNKTVTDITLQSNQGVKPYTDVEERPKVVYTVTDLRHYIIQALHKESLENNENTNLDVDPDSLQLENVETLPVSSPTSRPPDSSNNMDNALAAEMPPSIPGLEFTSNDVFIKNEDFLFDTIHPHHHWMGTQTAGASKNDIVVLEDNQVTRIMEIPIKTMDIDMISKPDETNSDLTLITENDITNEEYGFLEITTLPNTSPVTVVDAVHSTRFEAKSTTTQKPPVKPPGDEKSVEEHTEIGSGSGFSDMWPWVTEQPSVKLENLIPKAEEYQEDQEKKNVVEEKTEIPVHQTSSDVPLLDKDVFMTQDLTTDQSPVFFTMKTLSIQALSMQTKETRKMFDSYSVATVTELPGQVYPITKSPSMDGLTVNSMEINSINENTHGTTSPTTPTKTSTAFYNVKLEDTTTETLQQTTEPLAFVDIKTDMPEESSIALLEVFAFESSNSGVEIIEDITFEVSQAPGLEFADEDLAKEEIIVVTTEPVALVTEIPNVHASTLRSSSQFTRIIDRIMGKDTSPLHSTGKTLLSHTSDPIIPEAMTSKPPIYPTVQRANQNDAIEPKVTSSNNVKLSTSSYTTTVIPNGTDISERDLQATTILPFFQMTLRPTDRITDPRVDHLPMNDLVSTPSISFHENQHNDSSTAQSRIPDNPSVTDVDLSFDIIQYDDENGSGFAHRTDMASVVMPVSPGQALMVFFSLRVTNMMFSQDLFNKSSSEYKTLERQFVDLLVPYLQSNLSNFQHLEILNFRNGSIIVNSRMKFGKPVPHEVTSSVYRILENFCNTAYQTMNLAIDKYSLDVESGDWADPCKFQACNEFSRCTVNQWTGEAECVCDAGYISMDGLPCRSVCDIHADFCLNDGKCDIIPGRGAICRCRVGENWWYRGEHCEEYVSEPLVVGIAISSVAGFLLVASGVIFLLTRMLREQYDKEDSEDPLRHEDIIPSLEKGNGFESDVTSRCGRYRQTYFRTGDDMQNVYENTQFNQEEIPDQVRILELSARDHRFTDFQQQLRV